MRNAVRGRVPRKASGRPTAAAGYAEPYRPSSREIPKRMRSQLDAFMDIGWSQFALSEMAKNLQRPDADVAGIKKACLYHLKAIVRNKKKLGYDTAADEARIVEFRAIGIGGAATKEQVRRTGAKRTTGKPGPKASPKPNK